MTLELLDWIYPLSVTFIAYVVMGITGFGSALVLVPLLARKWPLVEVVTIAISLDIPASILHGGLNLKQVRLNELLRIMPGMAVGATLGLWLATQIDKEWMLLALGLYVAFVGLRSLSPKGLPRSAHKYWANVAGLLIGMVEVMFATAGPVVLVWLQRRLKDVAEIRATVPVVMVLAGSIALVILGNSEQINFETVMPRWYGTLPMAAVGVVVGNRLASHIQPLPMKRFMAVLLTLSGLSLTRHFWS